jgi:thiosulfate/3-mercaptopyruvate sulfurtransferase
MNSPVFMRTFIEKFGNFPLFLVFVMSIALHIPENSAIAEGTPLPGLIVSQDWLEANLAAPDLRIVQVGGEKYFNRFHIPGAVLVSYKQIVEVRGGVAGLRASEKTLVELFGKLGIGPQTRVVAYDLSGGMDASRLIWSLSTLGHSGGGAVLDGGLGRWYEDQRSMGQDGAAVEPVEFISQPDDRWLVTADQVDAASQGDWPGVIIDTRSNGEYIGTTLKGPRGHIKGAKHLDWSQTLRNPRDVRLKELDTLRGMYNNIGVSDPSQEIIVYCETGHRASQSWVLLRYIGFENVRLFDGSISEWRVLDLPVVSGTEPE